MHACMRALFVCFTSFYMDDDDNDDGDDVRSINESICVVGFFF